MIKKVFTFVDHENMYHNHFLQDFEDSNINSELLI